MSPRWSSRGRLARRARITYPSQSKMPLQEDNKIVQGIWMGVLSNMEKMCMTSFMSHGHTFHLYTYQDDLQGIPEGVIVKDANKIVPEERKKEFRWVSGFSDFLRYNILCNGGWYVDMDVVCLRPLDFTSEYVFASSSYNDKYEVLSEEDRKVFKSSHFIGNAFLKAIPDSPIMKFCRNCVENIPNKDKDDFIVDALGPRLFRRAVKRYGLEKFVQPPVVFDPVPFYRTLDIIDTSVSWDFTQAYVAHLNNSAWQIKGLSKDASYPAGSLYEQLKKRYL